MKLSSYASDTFTTLRAYPLRSLLSILGLVIGVAALVCILALADGMEQYGRDQLASTTDIQRLSVIARTHDQIGDKRIRRTNIPSLTPADAADLRRAIGAEADVALVQRTDVAIRSAIGSAIRSATPADSILTAATLYGADSGLWSVYDVAVEHGRLFGADDVEAVELGAASPVVLLSAALAAELVRDAPAETLLGRRITVGDREAEVIGILADDGRSAEAFSPFNSVLGAPDALVPGTVPGTLHLRAHRAEDVGRIAERASEWLDERFDVGRAGFDVMTNEMRVRQVKTGMLVFKLVFGLITGISVLVGGVGVMNVLLVTVTERTREIGIRKAVGARSGDIRAQFLAEAMTISVAGCAIGLLVGFGALLAMIPLIEHVTEVAFHARLTGATLLIVGVIAVVVGVFFGTYPAVRAARLDPVDAIRHE